ncbi:hypothetical protein [Streptosporangium sp. NPDC048865]
MRIAAAVVQWWNAWLFFQWAPVRARSVVPYGVSVDLVVAQW